MILVPDQTTTGGSEQNSEDLKKEGYLVYGNGDTSEKWGKDNVISKWNLGNLSIQKRNIILTPLYTCINKNHFHMGYTVDLNVKHKYTLVLQDVNRYSTSEGNT